MLAQYHRITPLPSIIAAGIITATITAAIYHNIIIDITNNVIHIITAIRTTRHFTSRLIIGGNLIMEIVIIIQHRLLNLLLLLLDLLLQLLLLLRQQLVQLLLLQKRG